MMCKNIVRYQLCVHRQVGISLSLEKKLFKICFVLLKIFFSFTRNYPNIEYEIIFKLINFYRLSNLLEVSNKIKKSTNLFMYFWKMRNEKSFIM